MSCCLFSIEPLPELILSIGSLVKKTSVKFENQNLKVSFHESLLPEESNRSAPCRCTKAYLKKLPQKWQPFCFDVKVLNHWLLGDSAVIWISNFKLILTIYIYIYLEHSLCPLVNATRPHWWLVNIRSVNGLGPSGNITWASVDPGLCHHMASLGHSKSTNRN